MCSTEQTSLKTSPRLVLCRARPALTPGSSLTGFRLAALAVLTHLP